ncbi:MAG: thermonuclease family protein [Clostridia bacterium]|nr:thermonuclease family protein [Clostridia bacterium]
MKRKYAIISVVFAIAMIFNSCSALTNEPAGRNEPAGPALPDISYEGMDFFTNGYESVEFAGQIDGDSTLLFIDGESVEVRFLAIDTPEMDADDGGLRELASDAGEFTWDILANAGSIIIERDSQSDAYDKYGRLLAWVWADGVLLNHSLVSRGFATVRYLYGDYRHTSFLFEAQEYAMNNGAGVWGLPD